jgi:hypothetical protein
MNILLIAFPSKHLVVFIISVNRVMTSEQTGWVTHHISSSYHKVAALQALPSLSQVSKSVEKNQAETIYVKFSASRISRMITEINFYKD